jgi:hypothetical protein
MTRAPAGIVTDDAGPSATIRFPRTTTVRFSRGVGLRPSMTVTFVNAVGCCAAAEPMLTAYRRAPRKTLNTEDTEVTEN